MTEREKLIQLIKAGHEKASDYFHKEAVAILKQGKSYSSKDRTKTFDEFVADTLIANGIGDIAEWKARAEALERALRNSLFDLLSIGCMVIDLGGEKDLTEKYNLDLVGNMPYRIKQAEKEIEEERK